MPRRSVNVGAALGVVAVLVLAALVGGASGSATPYRGNGHPEPVATALAASRPSSAGSATGILDAGPARAERILSEIRHSGGSTAIRPPDLSVAPPRQGQEVEPTYSQAPAPMGISDLGLTNVSGVIERSVLYTTSVEGTLDFTNALSEYLDGDGPDQFGIQLNAVLDNVTIFGNASNQFWTQAFVGYTPSSGELEFGDNVWNFSNYATTFTANSLYAYGPNGVDDAPILYFESGPTFTIHYPFTLTMYENSTVLLDRPALFLNYTISNATMTTSGSFDYLVFNATAGTPTSPYPAGEFQISGEQLDPVGLPNDLELDVVGTSSGDTTSFYEMDATISIATWNSTVGAYEPVPSAFDAGSETGETSDGVAVSFGGAAGVATLSLGPSFLHGLWGWSADSGSRTVVQTLNPAATLILVNPGTALNASASQWVPSSPTGVTTFTVPNGGDYWIEYFLADHTPGGFLLATAANSTTPRMFAGAVNMALGIYAPIIVFGNGELASVSTGGTGTEARPYTLFDNQVGSIDPEFAAVNVWAFPVFPGILLIGTTDYVSITPPSLAIDYPSWVLPELDFFGLPSTNHLQIQLWNASNVRIVGGTISGWLPSSAAAFPEGSVLMWNSSDDLVDGVTFLDQGDAVTLYGGTGNTIWGNYFFPAAVGATVPADVLNYGANTTGVNESEDGDLIYNNYFDVPVPAITPTVDPLSCQFVCTPVVYTDAWNVSFEPASAVETVLGEALTGSILGTWYQGGNYWSNYGNQSNPYGVLPYNDSGAIFAGGDYVPLTLYTLYTATFAESGLPRGATWGVTVEVTQATNASSLNVSVPNGTYAYLVESPSGYYASGGEFAIDGANITVNLTFVPTVDLTFHEDGLPSSATWSAAVNGSALGDITENESAAAGSSIVFAVPTGAYQYVVTSPGFLATPPAGDIPVGTVPAWVNVTFAPPSGTLSGRIAPAGASLYIDQVLTSVAPGGTFSLSLPAGLHAVEVTAPGYATYFNNVTVTASETTTLSVALVSLSAPATSGAAGISDIGWALIGFLALLAVLFLAMTLIFAGRRRSPPEGITPYAAPAAGSAGPASTASGEPGAPAPEPPSAPPPPPPPPQEPAPTPPEAPIETPPASPPDESPAA